MKLRCSFVKIVSFFRGDYMSSENNCFKCSDLLKVNEFKKKDYRYCPFCGKSIKKCEKELVEELNPIYLDLMKKCIGFNEFRTGKNKIYKMFRNWYTCKEPDQNWEYIVLKGYATCQKVADDSYIYSLNSYGISYLESTLHIKIIKV